MIAAGGVFLRADVCERLWRVLRGELARHRADGGRVRPEVAEALDALRAAALEHLAAADVRANGHALRTSPDMSASSERDAGLASTGELAARLGVTERHARRVARQEGITPAGRGRWHVEDVAALAAARRTDPHR